MFELLEQVKKTVVFLGQINQRGEIRFRATGFLLNIQNITHLATAKHVVVDKNSDELIDSEMLVFFNLKNGQIGNRPLQQIKSQFKVNWLLHKNKDVDVCIIPFGLDPQNDDVLTIPDSLFIDSDSLFELYDVFFPCYQPGIQTAKRINPILRAGTISLINADKTFYIDASAFPGNSGSPVFLKPSPFRYERKGGVSIGKDELGGKFIGIIGEYLPYDEVAISVQTGRPRVVFEENTGLSKVWPVSFLKEIVDLPEFKTQIAELRKNSPA